MAMALAFVLGQRGFGRLLCSIASVLAGSELETALESWAHARRCAVHPDEPVRRASNDLGCRVPRSFTRLDYEAT